MNATCECKEQFKVSDNTNYRMTCQKCGGSNLKLNSDAAFESCAENKQISGFTNPSVFEVAKGKTFDFQHGVYKVTILEHSKESDEERDFDHEDDSGSDKDLDSNPGLDEDPNPDFIDTAVPAKSPGLKRVKKAKGTAK